MEPAGDRGMKLHLSSPHAAAAASAGSMADEEEEMMIVNDVGDSLDAGADSLLLDGGDDDDAAELLPSSLIVTNLDEGLFETQDRKDAFEASFEPFGATSFVYFKSFRRVRVDFASSRAAASARIRMHQAVVGDRQINCYFAQVSSPKGDDGSDAHLQPPTPVKQYLISPPASPPVGWEPADEAAPIINYDLVTALAGLSPGEPHELHPPSESQPGIVVHHCEAAEAAGASSEEKVPKGKIPHTPRPERH